MIKLNAEMLKQWNAKLGAVVEITWLDHFSTTTNEAFSTEAIQNLDADCVRVSVGYLLKVTSKVMVIAATKEEHEAYSDITVLLVPVIREAQLLKRDSYGLHF